MLFQVTDTHIKTGIRGKGKLCPISLAMKDSGIENPTTNGVWIWYKTPNGPVQKHLAPFEVQDFVVDFDMGYEVKPFSFTL